MKKASWIAKCSKTFLKCTCFGAQFDDKKVDISEICEKCVEKYHNSEFKAFRAKLFLKCSKSDQKSIKSRLVMRLLLTLSLSPSL